MKTVVLMVGVLLSITQFSYCQPSTKAAERTACEKWGKSYPDKTEVCITGNLNRCDAGTWTDLGKKCVDTKPSCHHDGKGYPENSRTCFEGTLHQCELGSWNDLGTKCSTK